jgi:hypothetical protein
MSAGGNFDEQSASRISRAVRYVEGGWPVPTKQARRPPLADAGGTLQIVRLIENVPPAKLFASDDDFYEQFRQAVGERNVNEMDPVELLNIGSNIINRYGDAPSNQTSGTYVDRFFGSGLAWLCEFEPGRNREALLEGEISNVVVRYSEVVRVFNMHARGYNTNDNGGVFGNEAGGLGGGFCNVMTGWDGQLWLVQPDRRVMWFVETEVGELGAVVDVIGRDVKDLVEFFDANIPDWRSVVDF